MDFLLYRRNKTPAVPNHVSKTGKKEAMPTARVDLVITSDTLYN
jgi:hypothetical protein